MYLDGCVGYHTFTRCTSGSRYFCSLICLKRIYNFLCSMLVYTPFALCFVTLRGIFMHFPELNLLTRCHSASSLFSTVFVFQKSYTGNILRIGWNKTKPSIFPEASRSPKMRRRGARSQAHPRVARPTPSPRHQGVRPAGPPPDAALSPTVTPPNL
jgi:hypothetical protein